MSALKQVDVVISIVGGTDIGSQFAPIPIIKEAGTIKVGLVKRRDFLEKSGSFILLL